MKVCMRRRTSSGRKRGGEVDEGRLEGVAGEVDLGSAELEESVL